MFGEHKIHKLCENTAVGALLSNIWGLPAVQTWRFELLIALVALQVLLVLVALQVLLVLVALQVLLSARDNVTLSALIRPYPPASNDSRR